MTAGLPSREAPGSEAGCSVEGTVSAEHTGDPNVSAGQMAALSCPEQPGSAWRPREARAGRARVPPSCFPSPAPGADICHQTKRFPGGQLHQLGRFPANSEPRQRMYP